MHAKQLDVFFFGLKKYIVVKKNGFYILPFVANSPRVMIGSLSGIPYNTSDPVNNCISTNNLFTKSTLEYQEIEDGLWIMYLDLEVKKNISFQLLYDPIVECDYYKLAFRMDTTDSKVQLTGVHNFEYNRGIFSKPKSTATNFFHKNSKYKALTVCFSTSWLERNIENKANSFYVALQYFLNSERESVCFSPFFLTSKTLTKEIASIFSQGKGNANQNKLQLKIKTLELVHYFIYKVSNDEQNNTPYTEIVLRYIYQSFPGILHLSNEMGVSPSKFKSQFKNETNKTPFIFFQERQMILAKRMLSNDTLLIKNISQIFGYENGSKFSNAFKKYHGHLPSEKEY